MPLTQARRVPGATYRAQLHRGFTFDDLRAQVPWLRELGFTDCYCSPILCSTPGSTHGYDVTDYRRLDPELGGEPGLRRLVETLRVHDMGLLLDFVPNHMGVGGPFNPWWMDVLTHGRHSAYVDFFDIHWNDDRRAGRPQILLPVLEDHFGVVLERGAFSLRRREGLIWLVYGETRFPLNAFTYAEIFAAVLADPGLPEEAREPLHKLAEDAARLAAEPDHGPPAPEIARRTAATGADAAVSRPALRLRAVTDRFGELLRDGVDHLRERVEAALRAYDGRPGEPESFDALAALIDRQHYRLARWMAGAHEANYRRFFAIDSLVGLRMENEEVFRETHLLLGLLIQGGLIDGLRVDHIDGLWDPQGYLERLQSLAAPPEAAGGGTSADAAASSARSAIPPFYVVVEKILSADERLPETWPAHGTTGYEFIAQLGRLLTDPAAESRLDAIYGDFVGRRRLFSEEAYTKKRLVLEELFANAVHHLARRLDGLIEPDRRHRDLAEHELMVAVRELMAGLDVYRTYRRPGQPVTVEDRRRIEEACRRAELRNPRLDPESLRFVRDVLLGVYPSDRDSVVADEARAGFERWALAFQQYTGAVMAKAVEDTAFYTFNRLLALNEVGGDPALFGGDVEAFHAANAARRERTPHGLLTTATHDTKLGADARARLLALSEIPDEWADWLGVWRELNRRHKRRVHEREAPDAEEEYRFYQILLAAWPADDAEPDDAFRARIREHLRKAAPEAKRNTTWHHPDEDWLAAGDAFVDALLTPGETGGEFLAHFRARAVRLAHLGMVNSLAQLVLKITAPGVPDFYQTELGWDLSLVDPDNRREIDHGRRVALLKLAEDRSPRALLRHWRDGGVKVLVTRALLGFRRAHRALFREGDYVALQTRGRFADKVVAYVRRHEGEAVLVVVPRLSAHLGCPPLGVVWDDTAVVLPDGGGDWRDLLTEREHWVVGELPVAELLADLPFAVLTTARERPVVA